ncbi:MAG: dicarboxylate/amino acid:cation symporter [Clostridiaceae bacterium]|jgi:Na+/H+-dicarboxylate symporter|nr:dicarboxylate/amino acid:cation symporter [Clostridiaceae bacterium]
MNTNSIIIILISIALLVFLYFLKTKKVSFGNRVFIGMILGIGLGAFFGKSAAVISIVGDTYIGLIKMIVIPLIITTIISSVTSIEDTNKLKSIGLKTIGWLMGTTFLATIVGLLVGIIIDPGSGIQPIKVAGFKPREIPTFVQVLQDLIPSNIVKNMADGKVIPVVIFSIFIAIAIIVEGSKNEDKVKPVKDFFNSFEVIMFKVTDVVLDFTPYGVLGLMASLSAEYGVSTLIPLAKLIVTVYIACIIQITVVHTGLLAFVGKINPLKFYKKIYPAQVVAFTTRSSYGTLPATIKCLTNEVHISEKTSSFVATMGANMGMNGCGGLYPVIVGIFVARVFNVPLTPASYLMLIIFTTIASIGTAGVPGTASIMATVVLSAMGLPLQGIALVMGVDTIIDMARTATNVTGASVVSFLVAKSENEFDRESFNR